jgi:N-acetylneuraminate synthase
VALGARVVEKHFTDDTSRPGPDHGFSLDPGTWQQMVEQTRLLEKCLGDGVKKVEENEIQARIVQRRGLRFSKNLTSGTEITKDDLMALRPCPPNAISPFDVDRVIGKKVLTDVKYDQMIEWENLSQ